MKVLTCDVCGAQALSLSARAGRTTLHRQVEVPIPADFSLPECSACGHLVINYQAAEKLTPLLETAWERELNLRAVADLEVLAKVRPLYEWEQLLNLSPGYLSKIRGGKTPGAQLVLALRLLANAPERLAEVRALWAGQVAMMTVNVATLSPPQDAGLPRSRLHLIASQSTSVRTEAA